MIFSESAVVVFSSLAKLNEGQDEFKERFKHVGWFPTGCDPYKNSLQYDMYICACVHVCIFIYGVIVRKIVSFNVIIKEKVERVSERQVLTYVVNKT